MKPVKNEFLGDDSRVTRDFLENSTMADILIKLLICTIFLLYFYYVYKDDYTRNPKKFKRTIFGVVALFGLYIFRAKFSGFIRRLMEQLFP